MTWKMLDEEAERFLKEKQYKENLKEIAEIVASNPAWVKSNPRLRQLLDLIKAA